MFWTRAEIVLTGTKAQRKKKMWPKNTAGRRHWSGPIMLDFGLPPDILPCACSYSSARIIDCHFDLCPTFRELLLNESGSVWSYLVSGVYEIISYDVTRSRKASDVRHGIVFNVSVQRWCSVVQYKKGGSFMNNDRLQTRQINCSRDITFEPPPLKGSTCKWVVKSNAEIREGKLHVQSQMRGSLTCNFISEKWFWFAERLKTNTKLVIWRNKAAEIESVPLFWGRGNKRDCSVWQKKFESAIQRAALQHSLMRWPAVMSAFCSDVCLRKQRARHYTVRVCRLVCSPNCKGRLYLLQER